MNEIGFDSEKYLRLQSEKILQRISGFGGKLYIEFGGKLFDDYHAARVLPGFAPDNKIKMLKKLKDVAEIVIVISSKDIEKNKIMAVLAYIIFLIPLLAAKDSPFAKFHTNQGSSIFSYGSINSTTPNIAPETSCKSLNICFIFLRPSL